MIADELRDLLNQVPFRPFTVYLASEKAYEVPHRDFANVSPRGRTMIIYRKNSDVMDILDVPLIAHVEIKEAKA
jgi:hypothetical protein